MPHLTPGFSTYMDEHVSLVLLGFMIIAILAFLFVAVDIFNLRKEAMETNIRIAELNMKMAGMNKGIQDLVHYFMLVAEDIKTLKINSMVAPPPPAPSPHSAGLENYIISPP